MDVYPTNDELEYEQLAEIEENAFTPYIRKYCLKGDCDTNLFKTLQLTELMDLLDMEEVPEDLTYIGCCRCCASAAVTSKLLALLYRYP